jgi:hypothetical protein
MTVKTCWIGGPPALEILPVTQLDTSSIPQPEATPSCMDKGILDFLDGSVKNWSEYYGQLEALYPSTPPKAIRKRVAQLRAWLKEQRRASWIQTATN